MMVRMCLTRATRKVLERETHSEEERVNDQGVPYQIDAPRSRTFAGCRVARNASPFQPD